MVKLAQVVCLKTGWGLEVASNVSQNETIKGKASVVQLETRSGGRFNLSDNLFVLIHYTLKYQKVKHEVTR